MSYRPEEHWELQRVTTKKDYNTNVYSFRSLEQYLTANNVPYRIVKDVGAKTEEEAWSKLPKPKRGKKA